MKNFFLFLLIATTVTLGNYTYINDGAGNSTTITKIGNYDYYNTTSLNGQTSSQTGTQIGSYYYLNN